ncbi:AraC family transcriptional regulator [Sandaracinus amylolyticus]|uniref:AraC family transcriptional regulator n=1 Tax=Sandaracinus amylolyticus TaxID=927083 RepID=UPI001F46A109|nr:AraC family transcriptional regulator [Sandaracinus amylolyticus]UJR85593.1 Hypothetical protein I5071_76730 [Sandaracinus amylolyticus]
MASRRSTDETASVLDDVLSRVRLRASISASLRLGGAWSFDLGRDARAHFYVVTEGSARIVASGRKPTRLDARDVALVAAGTDHSLRDGWSGASTAVREVRWPAKGVVELEGGGPITRIHSGCLHVDELHAAPLWSALPDVLVVRARRARAIPALDAVLRLLEGDAVTRGPGGQALAARLADVLVIEMVREHLRTSARELRGWLSASHDPRLARSIAAMHRAPAEAWSVDRLARVAGMSRTTFATRFSAQVGRAPLEYLRALRLQHAAMLLREDESASIAEVAAQVGYGSEPAFRRAFKRWASTAPARFRRLAPE